MKKFLLTLGLLCGLFGSAGATTYNVTDDASMTTANNSVGPGDIVSISNATYTVPPEPNTDGTLASRITYVGNLTFPYANVLVPSPSDNGRLKWSYVTWKGMCFLGGASISCSGRNIPNGVIRDSLAYCQIRGGSGIQGGTSCVIDHCLVGYGNNEQQFTIQDKQYVYSDGQGGNKVVDTNLRLRDNASGVDCLNFRGFNNSFNVNDSLVRVVATATCYGSTVIPQQNFRGLAMYYTTYAYIGDFSFTITDTTTGALVGFSQIGWMIRDLSEHNRWMRDTLVITSGNSGNYRGDMSTSGNAIRPFGYNTYYQCIFKNLSAVLRTQGLNGIRWQYGITGDSLIRCSYVCGPDAGHAYISGVYAPTFVEHCNFAAKGDSVAALQIDPSSASDWNTPNTFSLRNSIMYTGVNANATSSALTLARWGSASAITDAYNLYADLKTGGGPGNAIRTIWKPTNVVQFFSPTAPSIYGTPVWTDSSASGYNPVTGASSQARTNGEFSSTIGAVEAGSDVTAPAAIGDLAVVSTASGVVNLQWTSPGDDNNSGTAQTYDLRYATFQITSGNFTTATPSAAPVPLVAGTVQTASVGGLTLGVTYSFAIKAIDKAGNIASISNVVYANPQSAGGKYVDPGP